MRKILGIAFASMLVLVGLSMTSNAQNTYRHNINRREARQQHRINRGVRSGRITAAERYRLERQQYRTRREEARYRHSGGRLTRSERYRLERRLNRTSRSIYRQRHDRQNYHRRYYRP